MKKVTLKTLADKKKKREKIVSVTAYDFSFARIIDHCDVDIILVGDSASNVCGGHHTTLPITLEEMIYHTKNVRRGVQKSFLLADLPFLSYQASVSQAVMSAGRIMKEGEAQGVKLEGGEVMADTVHHLSQVGIPVMGHIGFTPQSEHQLGGRFTQGRTDIAAAKILSDAKILEEAGAFALLLEMIPKDLAKDITESVSIPTIGIGAGPDCDGQVLVCYDLLGMNNEFQPKFLRKYANLHDNISLAINNYASDVRSKSYPADDESY